MIYEYKHIGSFFSSGILEEIPNGIQTQIPRL